MAVELKPVEPSAEVLADAVRQYRNLVHPGNELRNTLQVGKLEANSALNALQSCTEICLGERIEMSTDDGQTTDFRRVRLSYILGEW